MKQRFPVFIISTVITALSLVAPGLIAKAHSASVLTGKVLEKGTKRPLADVNVFLLPEKLKATSAANGTFEFSVDDQFRFGKRRNDILIGLSAIGYIRIVDFVAYYFVGSQIIERSHIYFAIGLINSLFGELVFGFFVYPSAFQKFGIYNVCEKPKFV